MDGWMNDNVGGGCEGLGGGRQRCEMIVDSRMK